MRGTRRAPLYGAPNLTLFQNLDATDRPEARRPRVRNADRVGTELCGTAQRHRARRQIRRGRVSGPGPVDRRAAQRSLRHPRNIQAAGARRAERSLAAVRRLLGHVPLKVRAGGRRWNDARGGPHTKKPVRTCCRRSRPRECARVIEVDAAGGSSRCRNRADERQDVFLHRSFRERTGSKDQATIKRSGAVSVRFAGRPGVVWGRLSIPADQRIESRIPHRLSRITHPHPSSRIADPESPIPNPRSRILDPESSIPNRRSRIADPESPIRNPRSRILDPESSIPNPRSRIADRGFLDPEFLIPHRRSGSATPESTFSESAISSLLAGRDSRFGMAMRDSGCAIDWDTRCAMGDSRFRLGSGIRDSGWGSAIRDER